MTADPEGRLGAPTVDARLASLLPRLVNLAGVLVPTLFLASLFPARLMFDATTAAGGDLGSHNYAAAAARQLLLAEHRITGWVPGNFNGFPLFQMYFPLPFALIVAASAVVHPLVAFKVVTVAGVLALPAAAFYCVRALKTPFPGPAMAASAVLPFLFQGANSAWGGNLPSTLAGEFAFSMSLPLALVFFAVYHRTFQSAKGAVAGAVVVALLTLTHAYTVLWVALASGLTVLSERPSRPAIQRLVLVFAAGGALCAFWLIPLLWYSPWTTAFKHLWVLRSPVDILPPILWPGLTLAVAGPVLLRLLDREAFRNWSQSSGLLVAAAAAAGLAYLAAPNFGIVDVRFLPFLQLALCLVAATSAGHLLSRWAAPAIWVPVAFLGAVMLAQPELPRVQDWIKWNYEGFERKAFWPVYDGIIQHLRGTPSDPRVAYEHSPDHEVLGSVRAFENLPLFSGRATLEGVNFQASVTSPFVFYVQSEISELMSCPFAEWGCSRPDLGAGVEHLAMMNVSEVILRSATMKGAARRLPNLQLATTVGPYEVYRVTGHQTGYAVPLQMTPYAVVTADWKAEAYRWFKRARSTDPVPVFVSDVDALAGAFAEPFRAVPEAESTPRRPLQDVPALTERVEAERIAISGCRPGHPVLIRISYHPGWESTSGERVWLAGAGYMLVIPTGTELTLVYREGAPAAAGRLLTILSLGVVLVMLWPKRGEQRSAPVGMAVPVRNRRIAIALYVSCGLAAAAMGIRARSLNADSVYLRGVRELDRGDTERARQLFQQARQLAPLSNTAIHSTYFGALTLYREERWDAARRAFRELVQTYPEAQAAAESIYHVGLCAERLGEGTEAMRAFAETQRRFPGTSWAELAAARLSDPGLRP